jgi:chitinase
MTLIVTRETRAVDFDIDRQLHCRMLLDRFAKGKERLRRHRNSGEIWEYTSTNYLNYLSLWDLCFFVLLLLITPAHFSNAQNTHWVMGYFPSWELGDGTTNSTPPLSAVDFSSMTVVAYFGFNPVSNATVDTISTGANYRGASALLKAAHQAGTKVIMSIGGWNTENGFYGASSPGNLNTFVSNITSILRSYKMDGVDIDWEPLSSSDSVNFKPLAAALRASLDAISPGMLLTCTCIQGNQGLMASVQQYFDEINIMTYDMSGNYSGWVSWYNSPIYNGGNTFPGTTKYVPSIDAVVKEYKAAGVSPTKIGIGAEFGGTVWEGLTLPLQLLAGLTSIRYDVPLYASDGSGIMQRYYSASNYYWDSDAQVGYLSIPGLLGLAGDFISYDDSNSIKAKADYIKYEKVGGLILYELGWGYPGNGSYPLLESVKAAFADSTVGVPVAPLPQSTTLSQNYPNPFNPTTTISFTLSGQGYVHLGIFNELGQEVAVLSDGLKEPGRYTVPWNASTFPSGMYICRLRYGSTLFSRKMLLVK